jgi:hypothetical protein
LKIAERRIKFSVKNNRKYKEWTNVFDKQQPAPILKEIFKYSIHGSRNALELLRLAFAAAGRKGNAFVSLADVNDAVAQLAQEKIRDLGSFYEAQYPDITDLISYVFEGFTMPVSRDDLESRIRTRVLDNQHARDTFNESRWAFRKTARRFIELLFEIGVVGFARDGRFYFHQEEDRIPLSYNVTIDTHPALKGYLMSGGNA